jgi:hypothetical protein
MAVAIFYATVMPCWMFPGMIASLGDLFGALIEAVLNSNS